MSCILSLFAVNKWRLITDWVAWSYGQIYSWAENSIRAIAPPSQLQLHNIMECSRLKKTWNQMPWYMILDWIMYRRGQKCSQGHYRANWENWKAYIEVRRVLHKYCIYQVDNKLYSRYILVLGNKHVSRVKGHSIGKLLSDGSKMIMYVTYK